MNENSENDQKALNMHPGEGISSDGDMQEGEFVRTKVRAGSNEPSNRGLADNDEVSAGEKVNAVSGYGQLLRAERLKRGLSVGEVARRLRLSVQQVNAIEEEDYSKLPSGTFLRGFVRNYGSLLQIDTQALLRLLVQSAPAAAPQNLVKQVSTTPFISSKRMNGGRSVLWVSLALILALLGYGMYQGGDWSPEPVMKEGAGINPSLDSQAGNGQVTMELFLPQDASAPPPKIDRRKLPEKRSPEIGLAPVIPSIVEPNVAEPVISNEKTLHFSFSKDSWVEIRDSDKKIIFVKTNPKGTEQVVGGIPPFYLVIGNASGVNLTYNGRPVDLAPFTRKNDDVARFSLE